MTRPNRPLLATLAGCLLLALPAGCSRSPYDADVSGVVTLDGAPIGPGVITFAPSGAMANPAVGAIAADGAYFLKTKHERGVDSGKYDVSVQVFEPEEKVAPGERSMQEPVPLVPEPYLRTDTSGLSFDVTPGRQTIDVALSSDKG